MFNETFSIMICIITMEDYFKHGVTLQDLDVI